VGIDLVREALIDSVGGFDAYEYITILALTIVMTLFGMTQGLMLGVFLSALTFVLQTYSYVHPIRHILRATSLRSSKIRTPQLSRFLEEKMREVLVVQLHGQLFFANATILAKHLESVLEQVVGKVRDGSSIGDEDDAESPSGHGVPHSTSKGTRIVVLDFTLVLGIDSSAAECIADLAKLCSKFHVQVVYVRGSANGFPCQVSLSDRLKQQIIETRSVSANDTNSNNNNSNNNKNSSSSSSSSKFEQTAPPENASTSTSSAALLSSAAAAAVAGSILNSKIARTKRASSLYVADDLDEAMLWCEEVCLIGVGESDLIEPEQHARNEKLLRSTPKYLEQLTLLCLQQEEQMPDAVGRLIKYFVSASVKSGEVLWRQGGVSDTAVLLVSGTLRSVVEEDEASSISSSSSSGSRSNSSTSISSIRNLTTIPSFPSAATTQDIYVGHLVGELGLINNVPRHGTLMALVDSSLLVLTKQSYAKMKEKEPRLALILSEICMQYMYKRITHVSNRIWESGSVPV